MNTTYDSKGFYDGYGLWVLKSAVKAWSELQAIPQSALLTQKQLLTMRGVVVPPRTFLESKLPVLVTVEALLFFSMPPSVKEIFKGILGPLLELAMVIRGCIRVYVVCFYLKITNDHN